MTPTDFDTLMRAAGYTTQKQMAEALGLSVRMIEDMVGGRRKISKRTKTQVIMLTQQSSNT